MACLLRLDLAAFLAVELRTPQYEFGAEASRTMWRVAFDTLAYPDESAAQAVPFLDPLNTKLGESFDPNALNGVISQVTR
jgi:hypothetical protein